MQEVAEVDFPFCFKLSYSKQFYSVAPLQKQSCGTANW